MAGKAEASVGVVAAVVPLVVWGCVAAGAWGAFAAVGGVAQWWGWLVLAVAVGASAGVVLMLLVVGVTVAGFLILAAEDRRGGAWKRRAAK